MQLAMRESSNVPVANVGVPSTSTTKRCYARAETMVNAFLSGGESKDAGGDGYGGDIGALPFCRGGGVISMYNGV